MTESKDVPKQKLVWILNDILTNILDAATWTETAADLGKLGWDVTLITMDTPEASKHFSGFSLHSIVPINLFVVRQVIFHIRASLYLLRHWQRVDVVLFHHQSVLWLLPILLWARLSNSNGPKMVMDTRTLPMSYSSLRDRLRAKIEEPMYGIGQQWASGHTAITRRMAAAIGISDNDLWGIWPSGVNLERFASAKTRHSWPRENEPVQLIYIGSLYSERNLMTLCRAMVATNQAGIPMRLTIIGAGPQWDELASMALQSGGAVRLIPTVPHDEVPAWLADAHVGVLPFPDLEIFQVSSPIKLFEYMAAGLSILATRIVCHTDVVDDDGYVFWIEGSDQAAMMEALARIWIERRSLPEMSDNAIAASQQWSWDQAARKLDAALRAGLHWEMA